MPSPSLRDELAALRIERRETRYQTTFDTPTPYMKGGRGHGGSGIGWRLASLLLWLAPLAALGGAAYLAYGQYQKIRPKSEVTTSLVQNMTAGEAEKLLSAKGYLKSRHQAAIGAKMPGRVAKMSVEEGSRVKKGDTIAELEHSDLDAMLESRKAQVRRAEAELVEAKADHAQKERKANRYARLRNVNQTSLEESELYTAASEMSAARVQALEASITLMKATVREAEETIQSMRIVAPFDGTVVKKEAEVGETIMPGGMGQSSSGRGAVVTLANLSLLEVETDIFENLMSRIDLDQPAEVAVSAVPDRRFHGRLRQIIPMGDRSRGTVKVKVEILDPDDRLFPELVAAVHFLPKKSQSAKDKAHTALFVAKAAIVEEAGHSYVWVVDDKSIAHKTLVEVVVTNDELARVESGVKVNQTVVLNPPKSLKDGELVKIVE
jgi:RND family efflux transporter MFP subunit